LLINTVYYWTIVARNAGGTAASATWSFTTVATPGPPALMSAYAGLWERTVINTQFPSLLQASVTDAGGNGISGISVTFAAPASGASGSFAGSTTVTTNAQGLAPAPAFTANAVAGSYLVTATAASLSTAFNLTNLSIQGIPSDFNGDGKPDIVWQDPVAGSSQVWFLNGMEAIGLIGAASISGANSWRIVAVADFNGDGQPDIVWQDPVSGAAQVWFLGSPATTLLGASTIALANPWRIVAAADFNLDGYPDLVWQDPASGAVQVWYLGGPQGTTLIGAANVTVSNPWHVVGAADFNGDGQPDLLWQDPVAGTAQIWYLTGPQGNMLSSAVDLSGPNPWRIASVADYNLDGHPDVVWQDPVSGESQVWFLNGTSLLEASILSGANPWRIAGPR